jgi:2,4-dienoyl-CoA reductase-like NADH-dependent reductase (Old Yellow Enzyme family)
MSDPLAAPLKLQCGATLSNRLAKAPMTEGLSDADNRATDGILRLYRRWSEGGAGLLISGNVQVDRRYLERPANVVIDGNGGLDRIRAYAKAGTVAGNHLWMQINQPGRQTGVTRVGTVPAPSAVTLHMPGKKTFDTVAMTEEEIVDCIRRFGLVARTARECGFTGVQIHSAHGYLSSQFLSGVTNQRTDAWGGSLQNRARFLLETVRAVRAAVGSDFPVGVKLNSADFQKGGFTNDECLDVVRWLDAEKVDLLELTGGNYERLPWGESRAESTIKREGYFLDYADRIRAVAKLPLMISGGMRTRAGMEEALVKDGMSVIGLGRPMCVDTDICAKLLSRQVDRARSYEDEIVFDRRTLDQSEDQKAQQLMEMWRKFSWFFVQLWRLGDGQEPDREMSVYDAFQIYVARESAQTAGLTPL